MTMFLFTWIKKWICSFEKVLICIVFLIFLLTFFYNIQYILATDNNVVSALIIFSSTITVLVILVRLTDDNVVSKKMYMIFLIAVSFLLRYIWVSIIKTEPVSDFEVLYKSAKDISEGNFLLVQQNGYFTAWPYQLGYVTFQALIIKLFGCGLYAIKLVNVIVSVATCVLIYIISSKIFNENVGRISGLFYAFFISSIYMCSVLTNQILATFLFYMALFHVVSYRKKYSFLIIGIYLGLGNIIRPEGPIVWIGICIFMMFWYNSESTDVCLSKCKLSLSKIAYIVYERGKVLAGTLIIFFVVIKLFDFFIINIGISSYPLSNRTPLWKYVVGLNYESIGRYNDKDHNYLSQFSIGRELDRESKKLIMERLQDKKSLGLLFFKKQKEMWGGLDETIRAFVMPGTILKTDIVEVLELFEKYFYTFIILSIVGTLIYFLKDNYTNKSYLLFLIQMQCFFSIHWIIEIQTRYRYSIVPSFFIISGLGIYRFLEFIKKRYFFYLCK